MRSIFDNQSLLDWLKKNKDRGSYQYDACCSCLLAQYFHEMGLKTARITPSHIYFVGDDMHRPDRSLPHNWDWIAQQRPNTFGAAYQRAQRVFERDRQITGRRLERVLVDEIA